MSKLRYMLLWLLRPQLVTLAGVACLCGGAFASLNATAALARPNIPYQAHVPDEHPKPPDDVPNCAVDPCLALTFDDGPNAVTTPQVLVLLEREHINATFFLVGAHVPGNEALLRRMQNDGDVIGNHSWDHADFTKLSAADIAREVDKTQSVIMAAGVPAPKIIRPPYGAIDPKVLSQLHLTVVRWNIDSEDWTTTDVRLIMKHITSEAKPGGIMLMHDTRKSTIDAITAALPDLKTRFRLVTVDQLFNLASGDQGDYFGR
jgi:peptidoglycan/xylan/chitin deacetylase (PgdA/CDA1 family)